MAHAATAVDTRTLILDAARSRLLADGYAGLSTRKVAEEAAVPVRSSTTSAPSRA